MVARRAKSDLIKLVVPQGFFWDGDFGGSFEAEKSSAENFATALHLDRKGGDTWDRLAAVAAERAVSRHSSRRGVICAPGEPTYNDAALDKLYDVTGTHGLDWAYPRGASTPVRAAPQASSTPVGTLKLHFVRKLDDPTTNNDSDLLANTWTQVVMPSGKTGFVAPGTLTTLYIERLCYGKDSSGRWRITGYVGGGD